MNTEVGSQWYNRIASEISGYKLTLGLQNSRKYKLDQLLRIVKRVDDFSDICAECQESRQKINRIVEELGLMLQVPDREVQKRYQRSVAGLIEHLKKVHQLLDKGHYTGIGIGIGLALGGGVGAALGAVADNPGIGTGIGIALGAAVGVLLDKRAKEEGKVI